MTKPDKKDWDITFSSQTISGSSTTKKTPMTRIGKQFNNIDTKRDAKNKAKNTAFEVIDVELDDKTQEPIVFIQRVGNIDERIPCRKGKPVYDPQQKVQFKSALPLWTWSASCDSGAEFKLGTEKTGEERYRFVSVDLSTREAVVETLDDPPESFTVLPVASDDTAAPNAGAADAGTLPPGTVTKQPATGTSKKKSSSNRQK